MLRKPPCVPSFQLFNKDLATVEQRVPSRSISRNFGMKYVSGLDKGQVFALLDIRTEHWKQQRNYARKFEHSFNFCFFGNATLLASSCSLSISLINKKTQTSRHSRRHRTDVFEFARCLSSFLSVWHKLVELVLLTVIAMMAFTLFFSFVDDMDTGFDTKFTCHVSFSSFFKSKINTVDIVIVTFLVLIKKSIVHR